MTAAQRDEPSLEIPRVLAPEEALKQIRAEQAAIDTKDGQDPTLEPRTREEYIFEIDFTDASGKRWFGKFKNKILTWDQRREVGIMKARMTAHTPWEAIDPETQGLLEATCHMTVSLVEKPPWFFMSGEKGIKNTLIVNAVWGEVVLHETFFRGPPPDIETSEA